MKLVGYIIQASLTGIFAGAALLIRWGRKNRMKKQIIGEGTVAGFAVHMGRKSGVQYKVVFTDTNAVLWECWSQSYPLKDNLQLDYEVGETVPIVYGFANTLGHKQNAEPYMEICDGTEHSSSQHLEMVMWTFAFAWTLCWTLFLFIMLMDATAWLP